MTSKTKHMEEFVVYVANLFNTNNINYWADFGTLLGIVRDNAIIEWDHDVDFSIMYGEHLKIYPLINKILSISFVDKVICSQHSPFKVLTSNGWHCDIYAWKHDGNVVRHVQQCFGLPFFPAYEISDFVFLDFKNTKIRVPKFYKDRLKRLYGDYMTPVKPPPDGNYWTGQKINEHGKVCQEIINNLDNNKLNDT